MSELLGKEEELKSPMEQKPLTEEKDSCKKH